MNDLFVYVVTKHGNVLRKVVIGYHYVWELKEERASLDAVLALAHHGRNEFEFSETALNYCRSFIDFMGNIGRHIIIVVDGRVICAEGPGDRFLAETMIMDLL